MAFDPSNFAPEATPRPASLAEARPGGLGLPMIRNFSDDLELPPQRGPQPSHDHRELDRGGMTPATLDWLLELRNQHGAGVDAIALFRGADPSAVIDAIRDCEIRILPAGAMLLQPGEANDTIYVLLSGQLAAYLDSALLPDTGIPIRPGESVGEMSAIDGKPVSAFVVALTEARVLSLPGMLFWSRLGPIPGVTRNLLAVAVRAHAPRQRGDARSAAHAARARARAQGTPDRAPAADQHDSVAGPSFPRARRYRDRRHDESRIRSRRRFLRCVLRGRPAPFLLRRRCVGPWDSRGIVHGAHDRPDSHRCDGHAQSRPPARAHQRAAVRRQRREHLRDAVLRLPGCDVRAARLCQRRALRATRGTRGRARRRCRCPKARWSA